MTDINLPDFKAALKRHGLRYKLKNGGVNDCVSFGEAIHLLDANNGIQVSGKVVQSFTEGEVYHWPLLSHENLAPLIEVIFIRNDLSIFITIDRETTLKDYIHNEDFLHDPRCYERKKSYAKGIFRGLSYLHRKSLCLMNLSDNNVVICRSTDQAIISDFSCLICSRRTTKSKLEVSELYKAPESDKGEFDATAAEIWAAGILMLDLFLAHMAPWAIVDHKPSKVLKLVDKLSYELLKVANIGSVISICDFEEFKSFLKCFFKNNPMARVTATNASISSFLSQKIKRVGALEKSRYLNEKFITKEIKKQYHPLDYVTSRAISRGLLREKTDNKKITSECTANRQIRSIPLDWQHNGKESVSCLNYQKLPLPENQISSKDMKLLPQTKKESQGINERVLNIPQLSTDEKQDAQDIPKTQLTIRQERGKSVVSNYANSNVRKFTQRYPVTSQENKKVLGSSYCCKQSKSLSILRQKGIENSNIVSSRDPLRKSFSFSEVKSSQISHKNSQSLNLTFNDATSAEEIKSCNVTANNIPNSTNTLNTDNFQEKKGLESVSHQQCIDPTAADFKINKTAVEKLNAEVNLPICVIVREIILLTQCEASLRCHPQLHSSQEFNKEQRDLLKAYQTLLHQEKFRLHDRLKKDYGLNTQEIFDLTEEANMMPRLTAKQLTPKEHYPNPMKDTNFEKYLGSRDKKSAAREKLANDGNIRRIREGSIKNTGNFQNSNAFSHCRTTENFEKCFAKNLQQEVTPNINVQPGKQVFSKNFELKEKLIEENMHSKYTAKKETKNRSKSKHGKKKSNKSPNTRVKCIANDDDVVSAETVPKRMELRKKSSKSGKRPKGENRNSLFSFCWCPGGRIEEPLPIPGHLCERCKLVLEDI